MEDGLLNWYFWSRIDIEISKGSQFLSFKWNSLRYDLIQVGFPNVNLLHCLQESCNEERMDMCILKLSEKLFNENNDYTNFSWGLKWVLLCGVGMGGGEKERKVGYEKRRNLGG